jgi:hypothetical protein
MANTGRRRRREDFVDRYVTGDPSEGFTTEEAIAHLTQMRGELRPAEFRVAIQQMVQHLPSDRRDELIALMRKQNADAATPAVAGASSADLLGGLLTGLIGATSGAGGPGIDDLVDVLKTNGQLDSPIARAVLGGIAAFGMQNQPPVSAVPVAAALETAQSTTAVPSPPSATDSEQPTTTGASPQGSTESAQVGAADLPGEAVAEPTRDSRPEMPQTALATALAHERLVYATYQQIKAAGDKLAEWEAQDRWEFAQQVVQEVQRRSTQPADLNQTLAAALAQEDATFTAYRQTKARRDKLAEWEAQDRWEAAQQLVEDILGR